MKTVLEILTLSTQHLKKHGIHGARRQSEEILADCLKIDRTQLYMEHDRPLTEEELTKCRQNLARRAKGEPLAYILGHVSFMDCRIEVNNAVLIPRQETEILADKIIKELASHNLEGKTFVDLCCGSGCIGIAIKKTYPALHVTLSDLSAQALEQAKQNAEKNGVDVEFRQGDLTAPFGGLQIDYLACNPPYVSEEDYPYLSPEVKDYEPAVALVASRQGLAFYERLNIELPPILKPNATVWLEIGFDQGPDMYAIFSNQNWINTRVEKDWAGKDRFCRMQCKGSHSR